MRPALFILGLAIAAPTLAAISIQPSTTSFDPSLHQTVAYTITVDRAGAMTAQILDRDLYVTKTLAHDRHVAAGKTTLSWDGTDDTGKPVADEAWSIRVVLITAAGTETYFPALTKQAMQTIVPDYYDRRGASLRYRLPVPSRVHLQAGVADPSSTSKTAGAVMKTIVNRAPRPAGAVVETWAGMDESNTVYVPDLPNFVVSIAATPLAENSVITYGNRTRDFVAEAAHRGGHPVVKHAAAHAHHDSLSTLDDVSPSMTAMVSGASWNANDKAWSTASRKLEFSLQLHGPTVSHFRDQPARMIVYVDRKKVIDKPADPGPLTLTLPGNKQPHVVAVNWASAYGPVAATAFRVELAE